MNLPTLSIIFYCYNEEVLIEALITQLKPIETQILKDYDLEILFVNDGSSDNTLSEMQKHQSQLKTLQIISYDKNKGVGGAIREGWKNSKGELVMTVPGELAFPLEEIPIMLKEKNNAVDVLIASYNHPQSKTVNVPAKRLWLSRGAVFLYKIVFFLRFGKKIPLYTVSSGFRLYTRTVIETIHFKAFDFLANSEIMIRTLIAGFRVKEHVTTLRWRQEEQGSTSKMRIFRTIRSHLKFMAFILFYKS